jgi:hypothetical protein
MAGSTKECQNLSGRIMSLAADNTLEAVRTVYSGAEGELWELLMGQQIHIGGFKASMDLAERLEHSLPLSRRANANADPMPP